MAERITFAAPHPFVTPSSTVEIVAIHKRRRPWQLHIEVVDDQGRARDFNFEGAKARQVIRTLNSSNNTALSEERRLLDWLITEGALSAGTYETLPDEPA